MGANQQALLGYGVGFTPLSLSNLERWYDMSQESGADNTTLASITDRSGNGATGTASGTPKIRTAAWIQQAAKNFVQFNNAPSYSFTSVSGTAQTVFAVIRSNDNAIKIYAGDGTLSNFLAINPAAGSNTTSMQAGGSTDIYDTGAEFKWFVLILNRNGATRTISVDGVSLTRTTSNITTETFAFSNVGGSNGFEWLGDIAEIGYYSRALTAPEQAQLLAYLAAKWIPPVLAVQDGNSLVQGTGASNDSFSYPAQMQANIGAAWQITNFGVGGQTIAQMSADFATQVAPLISPLRTTNVYVAWEFANSLTSVSAATAEAQMDTLGATATTAGFKTVLVVPTGAENNGSTIDAAWQAKYALIVPWCRDPARLRANGGNWDAVADVAGNAAFSPPGSTLNPTYFSDYIHLNDAGYTVAYPIIQTAIAGIV